MASGRPRRRGRLKAEVDKVVYLRTYINDTKLMVEQLQERMLAMSEVIDEQAAVTRTLALEVGTGTAKAQFFEEKKAAEVRAKGGTARGLDGASKFGLDIVPTPADGEKNKVCA
jgi:hypothetical protein